MSHALSRLIVGLGNPEKKYEYTRHNLGFLVVRYLAKEYEVEFKENAALNGLLASGKAGDATVHLLQPLTYVNNSGLAVSEAVSRKSVSLEHVLVVCDDINLPFGQMRLRPEGSDGGHNGLTSVIAQLKTKEFARLRMGVGRPAKKEEVVDFVLSEFAAQERKNLKDFVSQAGAYCMAWIKDGTKKTMEQVNQQRKKDE